MAISEKRDARCDNTTMSDEPVGIVISRGRRDEPIPAFSAFIWGPPASELAKDGAEPRAA